LASDISKIIKSEIVSTLESLLSASCSVEDVELLDSGSYDSEACVKTNATFEFSGNSSEWSYFIPAPIATQFEYLMLGGVTDLKETIDDEIKDAVQEIVSTISGSVVTSTNAQGFDDISGMKFTLGESSITTCDDVDSASDMYKLKVLLNGDEFFIYISFDDGSKSFVKGFTGAVEDEPASTGGSSSTPATGGAVDAGVSVGGSMLNSLLGEESIDNLKLLFDIKMRLSVRLGTKVCLLRDVISWDIGEIIELSQMTSEPLEILVNGVVIGTGEAIIVDGKFGVKIKEIGKTKIG